MAKETVNSPERETYLALSEEFTEINKVYNRALRTGSMTDELELKFLKAERVLHDAYKAQQQAKIEENN